MQFLDATWILKIKFFFSRSFSGMLFCLITLFFAYELFLPVNEQPLKPWSGFGALGRDRWVSKELQSLT